MSPGTQQGRPGRGGPESADGRSDRDRVYTAHVVNCQPSTTETAATLDDAIDAADRDWWSMGAQLSLAQLAATGQGFTAEHVADLVGEPSEPHLVGVAFAKAQRDGVIVTVGAAIGRDGTPRRVWWGAS